MVVQSAAEVEAGFGIEEMWYYRFGRLVLLLHALLLELLVLVVVLVLAASAAAAVVVGAVAVQSVEPPYRSSNAAAEVGRGFVEVLGAARPEKAVAAAVVAVG